LFFEAGYDFQNGYTHVPADIKELKAMARKIRNSLYEWDVGRMGTCFKSSHATREATIIQKIALSLRGVSIDKRDERAIAAGRGLPV
jgi:hypothetical protein